MARSTYFDLGRSADACPGSESGYAQRFQCGNIVKRRIWTRMRRNTRSHDTGEERAERCRPSAEGIIGIELVSPEGVSSSGSAQCQGDVSEGR